VTEPAIRAELRVVPGGELSMHIIAALDEAHERVARAWARD
jgi:hypothetical protein